MPKSVNIHAAACPGEFWGTDFNPSQAAHARALAEASGSGAILLDDSFAELAARPDLPEFDMIALHGIWTWVSEENRRVIIDIIRRKVHSRSQGAESGAAVQTVGTTVFVLDLEGYERL